MKDGKKALARRDGTPITEFMYDELDEEHEKKQRFIWYYFDNNLNLVCQEGIGYGVLSASGEQVVKCGFDDINVDSNYYFRGLAALVLEQNGIQTRTNGLGMVIN